MKYNQTFFATHHVGAESSARVIVPLLLRATGASSVVDVGCGIGTWLAEFARQGVARYHGLDGAWVDQAQLVIPRERFTAVDLGRPPELSEKFDLAISLEVGEHLAPEQAEAFVGFLVKLAPVVAFSAAIPLQGGTGHVNEQWPAYWAAKFAAHGYESIDFLRPQVWEDAGVEWWYAQNTVVYASADAVGASEYLTAQRATAGGVPRALVHPGCFLNKATQPVGMRRMVREFPAAAASMLGLRRAVAADQR